MKLRVATPPTRYELLRLERPIEVQRLDARDLAQALPPPPLPKVVSRHPAADKAACRALATDVEWRERRACIVGKQDFAAGDIEELHWNVVDGYDVVPHSPKPVPRFRREKSGCLKVYLSATEYIGLLPSQYTGTPPTITVPQSVIDALDQTQHSVRCRSIVAGELELS